MSTPMLSEERAHALRADFWTSGYFVLNGMIGKKAMKYLAEKASELSYTPIFNRIYRIETNDNKRLMAKIRLENTSFHARVVELAQSIYPGWDLHKWTVIKSLPGGMTQDVHRDFPTFETALSLEENDWVQASLFIAIDEDTQFDVFPQSFTGAVHESKRVRVKVPKGSLFLFRGDLPHAGVSYDREHIRLHCYLRVRGIEQKEDATESVPMDKSICFHCFQVYPSNKDRDNHARYCKRNPKKSALAEKRKRINDEGKYCNDCNHQFNKKDTYTKHKPSCRGLWRLWARTNMTPRIVTTSL